MLNMNGVFKEQNSVSDSTTFMNMSITREDGAGSSGLCNSSKTHLEILSDLAIDISSTKSCEPSIQNESMDMPSESSRCNKISSNISTENSKLKSNCTGKDGYILHSYTFKRHFLDIDQSTKKNTANLNEENKNMSLIPENNTSDGELSKNITKNLNTKSDADSESSESLQSSTRYLDQPIRLRAVGDPCPICGRRFISAYSLKSHLVSHSHVRPFTCNVCNKKFKRNCTLKDHERRHEKYRCELCGKGFLTTNLLKEHENCHKGEKPFCCDICGDDFVTKEELVTHETSEHRRNNVFLCEVCGREFSTRQHLKVHCLIHTGEKPFPCDVCGKSFRLNMHLKEHLRIHTGERPFPCNICGKAFTQKSSLVIHTRIHSGERPYECSLCHKGFTCNAALKIHSKTPCI